MKTLAVLLTASLAFSTAAQAGDPVNGKNLFRKCKACHSIVNGDKVIYKGGKFGPDLYGVIGRKAGTFPGYRYSKSLAALGATGFVWTEAELATWVANPKAFLKDKLGKSNVRTKMTYKLRKGGDDVAAYLASVAPASN